MLASSQIRKSLTDGDIVIEPFNEDQLGTSSYDVTLGEFYWKPSPVENMKDKSFVQFGHKLIFNPFNLLNLKDMWKGPFLAHTNIDIDGFEKGERYIILGKRETILAHTNEYIGSRRKYSCFLSAKSTIGRKGIEICKCANFGNVGYHNKWTLEITNNMDYDILLKVGMKIGQITFIKLEGEPKKYEGNYNHSDKTELPNWTPNDMLPKY